MNKLWSALALIISTQYSFAAADKPTEAVLQPKDKPMVSLQVLDISKKNPQPIAGNTLSISKKQNQLCWRSYNMLIPNKVMIAEAFYAPDAIKFTSPNSTIEASKDKKEYLIVTEMTNMNTGKYVGRCWTFNKTDPIGKYKMEIQINDQVFKGLEFELVK